ncbi:DUF2637 domain-containing protein [Streptomyces nitrosporeus]|uniref:DUF2637 domain-containing protein n=1 Tax=Streptomyces nitrosporeus TaxID=28894 RepID=UPI00332A3E8F
MAAMQLTRTHRVLIGVVVAGAVLIAAIGFAGSYAAVRELAEEKGFGQFSLVFPIGIDAGICVLLALDLLLTWMRIPFPMLRQTAWLLTAATIAFNGAAAWPDPLGTGMHAVIPVLFVVAVEAARHAVGRIADITADKHMEGVRITRWLLSPVPTFKLWRRMKLWELRSYEQVIKLEQERLIYQARLQARFGRNWRRKAPIESMMPLRLARYGVPLSETAPAGLAAAGIEPALLPPAPADGVREATVAAGAAGGPQALEAGGKPQLPYAPQQTATPEQPQTVEQPQAVEQPQTVAPEQHQAEQHQAAAEQQQAPEQPQVVAPEQHSLHQLPLPQQVQPSPQQQLQQHPQQGHPQQAQQQARQGALDVEGSPWFAPPLAPDAPYEGMYDPAYPGHPDRAPVQVPTGADGRTRPLGNVGTLGGAPLHRSPEQPQEGAAQEELARAQAQAQAQQAYEQARAQAQQPYEQAPAPQREQHSGRQQPQRPDHQRPPEHPQAQAPHPQAPHPEPQAQQTQPQAPGIRVPVDEQGGQDEQDGPVQPYREDGKEAEWAAAEAEFGEKAYEVFVSYTQEHQDYPSVAVLDIVLADGHDVRHPRSGALLRRLLPGFKQRFDTEMSADHIA